MSDNKSLYRHVVWLHPIDGNSVIIRSDADHDLGKSATQRLFIYQLPVQDGKMQSLVNEHLAVRCYMVTPSRCVR